MGTHLRTGLAQKLTFLAGRIISAQVASLTSEIYFLGKKELPLKSSSVQRLLGMDERTDEHFGDEHFKAEHFKGEHFKEEHFKARLYSGENYNNVEEFKADVYRGDNHFPPPYYPPSNHQPYLPHPHIQGPRREVTCPLAERLVEDEERTLLQPTRQAFHGSDLERYKLEKKRERNRIAASKCRMRKMERISQLDGQVAELQVENQRLGAESQDLRQEVEDLQARLDLHLSSGECRLAARTPPDSTEK